MTLREIAAEDCKTIMNDTETAMGWAIKITDPDQNFADLVGRSNDIAQAIDPDTGQLVTGRIASVALFISDLTNAGLGMPEGIQDKDSKPWIVDFNDINGNPFKFKVVQANPDRVLGLVVCILALYKA